MEKNNERLEKGVYDKKYSLYPLIHVMEKLLSEDGCPWDKEQTHESLKRCLIEECYEVVEAIEEKSMNKLVEELGDLLLQIVFHTELAKKGKCFEINDVVNGIVEKMVRRHPHVFGKVIVENSAQVLENWEKIKSKEKNKKSLGTLMDVPRGLPALIRAEKIQKKAAKVGFDWPSIEGPWDKVGEEIDELKEAVINKDKNNIKEEIGDILFAIVNISRFLNIDPEDALAGTNEKFMNRFKYMEKEAIQKSTKLENLSLHDLNILYEEAKK